MKPKTKHIDWEERLDALLRTILERYSAQLGPVTRKAIAHWFMERVDIVSDNIGGVWSPFYDEMAASSLPRPVCAVFLTFPWGAVLSGKARGSYHCVYSKVITELEAFLYDTQ